MPVKTYEMEVAVAAPEIIIWDVEVTVYVRVAGKERRLAEAGECRVWIEDVDEVTGNIVYTTSRAVETDASGKAVITGFCGGMYDMFGNVVGNRYRVNVEHKPTGTIARDNNLWVSNEGCEAPRDMTVYLEMERMEESRGFPDEREW